MNAKDEARERTWQLSLTHKNGSRNWALQKPEDLALQGFEMYAGKELPKSCHKRSEKTSRKGTNMSDIMQRCQKLIIMAWKMNTKSLLERCRTISTRMLRNWIQNGFARGPKYILKPCQNYGSTYKNYNGQCIDNWHNKLLELYYKHIEIACELGHRKIQWDDHDGVRDGAKRVPNGDQNGAKRVPNGNQNGTQTDPKWSWDLKLDIPCKVIIWRSFLDAFWACPRVRFGTKICRSSMEKQSKTQSKKWCWKRWEFYCNVIRNWT